jgi:hypothetical protein
MSLWVGCPSFPHTGQVNDAQHSLPILLILCENYICDVRFDGVQLGCLGMSNVIQTLIFAGQFAISKPIFHVVPVFIWTIRVLMM